MVIAISTGSCYDLGLNPLESIHFLEKYKHLIQGIEVALATPQEFKEFKPDNKALEFLKSLDFVSIHLPFQEVRYANNKETQELLTKAEALAKQINAQHLIIHPNTVDDFNSLKTSIPICIENLNKKPENKGYFTVEEMSQVLKQQPNLYLALDIAHALGNNINPTEFLTLKNKIREIHVNGQWIKKGNLKEHGFLTEGTPEQLEKVKETLKLNVPKVIEADIYPEKLPLLEKEIQLIKQLETSQK